MKPGTIQFWFRTMATVEILLFAIILWLAHRKGDTFHTWSALGWFSLGIAMGWYLIPWSIILYGWLNPNVARWMIESEASLLVWFPVVFIISRLLGITLLLIIARTRT